MRELEGDEISRFPMRPSWQAGRQAGSVGPGNKWQREDERGHGNGESQKGELRAQISLKS